MNLDSGQRGALVESVVSGGPADDAGLRGSQGETTVDGQQIGIGGDVVVAFQGMPVQDMDDLIAFLSSQGQVGQRVKLDILRDGQKQSVEVTLAARPAQEAQVTQTEQIQPPPENQPPQETQPPAETQPSGTVFLGIVGTTLVPEIAQAMNLSSDQQGVLVIEVQPDSPADRAGLRAGTEELSLQGRTVLIGGDVITGFNGQKVATIEALVDWIQSSQAGDQVTLTILRGGEEIEVQATLAERSQ
jgi:S1-C subfamily serine protease